MAGELVHSSAGTNLTQAEFEAVGLHVCNNQVTGDLIYASSASQFSRLAIGAADTVLTCDGSVPSWSATPILNNAIGKGTWTASGTWTLPAIKLGASIDTNTQLFTSGAVVGFRINAGNLELYHNLLSAGHYISMSEMAAPGAGGADYVRIYAVVGGDTFTDLAAVFQDGTVDIFAQESTPLDSPIFTQPSQTEFKMVMEKPHPGLIKFVAKYPDGGTFTIKELQYHDADKIASNTGCLESLPIDWFVETHEQRSARIEAEKKE